jgi:hypothetical protein
MPDKKAAKLTVTVSGKMLFIEVPSTRSEALLRYLRSKGVTSSPPSPHRQGTDSIELGRSVQAEVVQTLLDKWTV